MYTRVYVRALQLKIIQQCEKPEDKLDYTLTALSLSQSEQRCIILWNSSTTLALRNDRLPL